MKKKIRVGSRESKLAVAQTMLIINNVKSKNPELEFELITMKTTGDIILDKSLEKIGGKGLFVKELDLALLDGRIDFAVHSLKDMPMEDTKDLPIIAFSNREDARDSLVLPFNKSNIDVSYNIGSSSARRRLQIKNIYKNANVLSIRGNVLTRLEKLDKGEYSALILASAGLKRLGLSSRINRCFSIDEMIPSAGQGVLAIQGRNGENYNFLECINSKESQFCAVAEREFVKTLDCGCHSPVAAYAQVRGTELCLRGFYHNEETGVSTVKKLIGQKDEAQNLGYRLAKEIKREVD